MSTMTLLEMTQNILSALSSDEVNSISDTTESMQVAEIIKNTYFSLVSRGQLAGEKSLFQLDDSGDVAKPVLMFKPDFVDKIEWMQYYNEEDKEYKYITLLPPTEFMELINKFDRDASNVAVFDFINNEEAFTFKYKNDTQPSYCMASKNFYLVFDSYDNTVDDTLQAHKTRCWGQVTSGWNTVNSYIPALNENLFPLLLNEAKALAFFELKQASHPKAEQESRRQWVALQRNKALVDKPTYFDALPNFGRQGSWKSNSSSFKDRGWR